MPVDRRGEQVDEGVGEGHRREHRDELVEAERADPQSPTAELVDEHGRRQQQNRQNVEDECAHVRDVPVPQGHSVEPVIAVRHEQCDEGEQTREEKEQITQSQRTDESGARRLLRRRCRAELARRRSVGSGGGPVGTRSRTIGPGRRSVLGRTGAVGGRGRGVLTGCRTEGRRAVLLPGCGAVGRTGSRPERPRARSVGRWLAAGLGHVLPRLLRGLILPRLWSGPGWMLRRTHRLLHSISGKGNSVAVSVRDTDPDRLWSHPCRTQGPCALIHALRALRMLRFARCGCPFVTLTTFGPLWLPPPPPLIAENFAVRPRQAGIQCN